jgi:DNA-binding NtrC family response regulator
MVKMKLQESEREFFSLVWQAAFANPFSAERAALDRKIVGGDTDRSWPSLVPKVVAEIEQRLVRLDETELSKIEDFQKADRAIIEHVFLFDVFHKFAQRFDEHIENQISAGDEPLEVSFASEALDILYHRGFSKETARRYFALFYQIRRAYHFINKGLIGQSESMRQLRMHLWNNIFTHDIRHYERYLWDRMEDFSTLLLGPTGCGKGAAAAAIGRSGFIEFDEKKNRFAENFTKTFIPINLSQYAETLLESELFGHTKGAFTGAVVSHEGLFSLCGVHGSIFLDEIGEIGQHVQIKLLKVLEERIFSPVGSHEQLKFHGRVIAATNKSIDKLRQADKFRDDFYYRLCSDCITVPSLKERTGENPNELWELVAHSVRLISGQESEDMVKMVIEVIDKKLGRGYHWPGNVRELAQCVRSVIIKRDYEGSQAEAESLESKLQAEIEAGGLTAGELLSRYCALLYKQYGTYEEVGRKTGLDRRTVKKHIQS